LVENIARSVEGFIIYRESQEVDIHHENHDGQLTIRLELYVLEQLD